MDFELAFTDQEITPWGGMVLMKRMLDHLQFEQALKTFQFPPKQSNRGYEPEQLVTQFMLSVWCGANRFEHAEVTRHDPVLKDLFGFKTMANFKAIMRLLKRFTQQDNDRISHQMYRWLFDHLKLDGLTLDLDSTVMTRYGKQLGAARGYNPRKRGRPSHHPLMAFISDTRMIANCWLRPGNTSSSNHVQAFLESTLQNLGNKRVSLLRADSGFSDNSFLDHLEEQGLNYIIALKQHAPLQKALIDAQGWWLIDEGIDLVSFEYQAPSWSRPRRVIGIRQDTQRREDPKGKTLSLFSDQEQWQQYRFSTLVTDLTLPTQEIWRSYRGRADCENRIKELKYDFGADSFCMNEFWATEASMNLVMTAYNLMSLFRQAALRSTVGKVQPKQIQHTLNTLRYKLFAKAAFITRTGRKNYLNLVMDVKHRTWFEGVWDRTKTFDKPVTFSPVFTP